MEKIQWFSQQEKLLGLVGQVWPCSSGCRHWCLLFTHKTVGELWSVFCQRPICVEVLEERLCLADSGTMAVMSDPHTTNNGTRKNPVRA